ncbi:MAG: DUF6514 family protein [Oscillospiraceae bacterium]|nr:DUF6514 family protein [Oscillospiraceae bacterium]MDD4413841.1 DUF6514 family protein [Oscillospiraceae bacterium]
MNTIVEKVNTGTTHLLKSELIKTFVSCPERNCDVTVFGIKIEYSNGDIEHISDISTKQGEVEILINRMNGGSVSANHTHDIIDDYLAYINGS